MMNVNERHVLGERLKFGWKKNEFDLGSQLLMIFQPFETDLL